ncbi:hypothetical protein [Chromobacterium sp. CV08]|uniref:hypothetical protein n=1 Tax=Chromobacterium sp. CV08 TaxID=3133274 RepID=UPI003DA9E3C5
MLQPQIYRNRDYPGGVDGVHAVSRHPPHGFLSSLFEYNRHCCKFCGYRSREFMEAEPLDDDYGNEAPDNWLVLCHYCRATQHVGAALRAGAFWGVEKGRSQEALNRLCRAWPWLGSGGPDCHLEQHFEQSARLMESYMGGRGTVDNLATFLRVLAKSREDSYEDTVKLLTRNGLRLIFPPSYRPLGIDELRRHDRARAEQ